MTYVGLLRPLCNCHLMLWQANLMYLAIITQRIPVLPHFTPSAHVHGASISAGEIFDLGRLSDSIGLPVLEWKDVKASNSSSVDTLDCWNLWEVVSDSHSPFGSPAPHDLGLSKISPLDRGCF